MHKILKPKLFSLIVVCPMSLFLVPYHCFRMLHLNQVVEKASSYENMARSKKEKSKKNKKTKKNQQRRSR